MSVVHWNQKPDINAIVVLLASHPDTREVLQKQLSHEVSAQAFLMHLWLALELNKDGSLSPSDLYETLVQTLQDSKKRRLVVQYFTEGRHELQKQPSLPAS
jgi:Tat protein secretion system quality control protein TatD with DNase activity